MEPADRLEGVRVDTPAGLLAHLATRGLRVQQSGQAARLALTLRAPTTGPRVRDAVGVLAGDDSVSDHDEAANRYDEFFGRSAGAVNAEIRRGTAPLAHVASPIAADARISAITGCRTPNPGRTLTQYEWGPVIQTRRSTEAEC